ncbi:MAG: ribosome small subunit-dependent GTPase A [Acidothermaceae bacterium]
MPYDLAILGWDDARAAEFSALEATFNRHLIPGRVSRVDRGAVTVLTKDGQERARPSGRLFHDATAIDENGSPAVGDWVALDGPVVVALLARRSAFQRAVASGESVAQVVASNVDTVFVVAPLVGRPRPRLVQRCLALAWQSGATPVVLLTKKDLCPDVESRLEQARTQAVGVAVHAVSAATGDGLDDLACYLSPGATVAMIGPSGAGKSTLANALSDGLVDLATGAIRDDGRGRHITTARELVTLPGGAVAIDTPGLRGLALWEADDGIVAVFADVNELARDCRFADCQHAGEPGCAVGRAIDEGDLAAERLADYQKLQREQRWIKTRRDARARSQERARNKAFFKSVRNQPHR